MLNYTLWWQQKYLSKWHEAASGEGALDIVKGFFTREWSGNGMGSQGSGHSPWLTEFKKHLTSALRHGVLILCGLMWS